jgi:hypothetical protein
VVAPGLNIRAQQMAGFPEVADISATVGLSRQIATITKSKFFDFIELFLWHASWVLGNAQPSCRGTGS